MQHASHDRSSLVYRMGRPLAARAIENQSFGFLPFSPPRRASVTCLAYVFDQPLTGPLLGAVAGRFTPDQVLSEFERQRLKRVRFVVQRAAEGRYGAHGPRLGQVVMRALLRAIPSVITSRMMRVTQTMPNQA